MINGAVNFAVRTTFVLARVTDAAVSLCFSAGFATIDPYTLTWYIIQKIFRAHKQLDDAGAWVVEYFWWWWPDSEAAKSRRGVRTRWLEYVEPWTEWLLGPEEWEYLYFFRRARDLGLELVDWGVARFQMSVNYWQTRYLRVTRAVDAVWETF